MTKNSLTFNPKYTLYKIAPKLYCVEMENPYDLAMLFVRYQEYYESPNPNVKGKVYSLEEYMRWYAISNQKRYVKGSENLFTYPKDFCGFNIPSSVIYAILAERKYSDELSMYDHLMTDIYIAVSDDMHKEFGKHDRDFYLIGAGKMDSDTLRHEIAHGLYHNVATYRDYMNGLIKKLLTPQQIVDFKKVLRTYHYCEDVMLDEMQAFLSTGTRSDFPKVSKRKQFVDYFNLYFSKIKPKKVKKLPLRKK